MLSSKFSSLSRQIIIRNNNNNANQLYQTKENIISTLLRQRNANPEERNYWRSAYLFRCHDELLEKKSNISDGPGLEFFIANPNKKKLGINERLKKRKTPSEDHPYLKEHDLRGDGQKGIECLFCKYLNLENFILQIIILV